MTSTWKSEHASEPWTHHHWLLYLSDGSYKHDKVTPPVHAKTDKIPVLSVWRSGGWMFWRSLIPIAIEYSLRRFYNIQMSHYAAFGLYLVSEVVIAINHLHTLRYLGNIYGYFDGHVQRDGVPDLRVSAVAHSLLLTALFRMVILFAFAYDPKELPSLHWLLPLQMTAYTIILDGIFYTYHRLMHDVDWLWKFHSTHHKTKHPNAQLSLYADQEQEWFDIVFVPLLAFYITKAIMPFNFYAWWITGLQVLYIEAWGHSGIRVYATPANAGFGLLRLFGAELTIEDHDFHHRQGWRKSHNYGKQTRFWDKLFGTAREREEARDENVDWNKSVPLSLF